MPRAKQRRTPSPRPPRRAATGLALAAKQTQIQWWTGVALRHGRALAVVAVAIRFALIAYGAWQDAHWQVKYSDVDYAVVSDGALLMLQGRSPFERTTYRYSPLLAALLIPNHLVHEAWGKLVFVAFDVMVAGLLAQYHPGYGLQWLYNPVVIGISTRGSSDAIVCAMILAMALCIRRGNWVLAGALHGLSVHWRLFPIIFAPALLLRAPSWRHCFMVSLVSASTFAALGLASYAAYGWDFVHETFLYHATRTDVKHNFSPWFYLLYLSMHSPWAGMGLAAFAPQVITQLAIVWRFAASHFDQCLALQTLGFVTFNKVVTAQYFVWYIALLPMAVGSADVGMTHGVLMIAGWLATELHWLYWAYRVEFLGLNDFRGVFVAGVLFFAVNVGILVRLMRRRRLAVVKRE